MAFVGLLVIAYIYAPNEHILRVFAGFGVFAILFACEEIANMVFKKNNRLSLMIINVSYASMACYMYHRLFFWIGEKAWNPSPHGLKWFYMAGLVFPIMLVCSYYIQKGYDGIIKHLDRKKN